MSYGLRFVEPAGIPSNRPPPGGAWLERFDPEAHAGRGEAAWTADPAKAMRFESAGAAMKCWRMQSLTVPTRPDGKANRPLTAFTVMVEALP